MTTGYPAILILDGRLGVVVGGGAVGARKARTLLDSGARVRIVDPEPDAAVRALARREDVEVRARAYEHGDLDGAAVAIASTDDPGVNHSVFNDATARGIPINVVDDPPRSTFIAPSIVRRGDLLIAISTGGTNPAMAVRIRERLEEEFGDEYAAYFALIRLLKATVEVSGSQAERAAAWYRVVDSDVFDLVREGRIDDAEHRARELLAS